MYPLPVSNFFPSKVVVPTYYLNKISPKNCMKIKEIEPRGGHVFLVPLLDLQSSGVFVNFFCLWVERGASLGICNICR